VYVFATLDCKGVTLVAVAYQLNIGAVNPFTSVAEAAVVCNPQCAPFVVVGATIAG
jgi:hypothetical protein